MKCSKLIREVADIMTYAGDIDIKLGLVTENTDLWFDLTSNDISHWNLNKENFIGISIDINDVKEFKKNLK